jgi:hypothetical protein
MTDWDTYKTQHLQVSTQDSAKDIHRHVLHVLTLPLMWRQNPAVCLDRERYPDLGENVSSHIKTDQSPHLFCVCQGACEENLPERLHSISYSISDSMSDSVSDRASDRTVDRLLEKSALASHLIARSSSYDSDSALEGL